MLYNVITQDGMTVGQPRTLEEARDLAEDVDGVVKPLEDTKTSTGFFQRKIWSVTALERLIFLTTLTHR